MGREASHGEPVRRCLACNTCINEMRGGARIGCVVNGAAGRETMFVDRRPPRGERIAVIGAGPAGLTYASLVAAGNEVTVFEKDARAGGAFRYTGKAPLFQEVTASEASFERYVGDLVAACTRNGVKFRFECDVADQPDVLAPFDRLVIATGARYRLGLGTIATNLLDWGAARSRPFSQLFSAPMFRDWFYYKGPTRNSRPLSAIRQTWANSHRHRRCRPGRQEQRGDRERVRGCAASLRAFPIARR
jgi:dimethylglycine catabolism A